MKYAIWDYVPVERKIEALKYEYTPLTDEPPGVIEEGKNGPCPRVIVDGLVYCPFGIAYSDKIGNPFYCSPASSIIVGLIETEHNIVFDHDDYVARYDEASDFTDAWDAGLVTDLRAAMGLED